MKKYISIIFLAIAIFSFQSCEKDTDPQPEPTQPTGQMRLEFDHIWGSEDNGVILEQEYVLNNNDTVKFNTIKYYISNVKLRKTDGTWWSAPESYYLVDASNSSSAILSINDIPKADYNSISFLIGVDSTRNVSGAQTGALAVSNNMFWSWNTGYIFSKFEGLSNQAMGGSFTYHIGGFSGPNNALQQVELSTNGELLQIKPEANPQAHLLVDLSQIWTDGVSLSSTAMVHMPGANALKIARNFKSGITFDHIHN
jgi:hypothetical protein